MVGTQVPKHMHTEPVLYSFPTDDDLSKGLADFVIKVSFFFVLTPGAKRGDRAP